MKTWLLGLTIAALAVTMLPNDAAAKRLGGGKSTGMQRDMPARTAPDATPGKPANGAAPANQTPAGQNAQAPAAAGATAAAAAPAKRSWMGPLAGLAAGLGLAALMSHLGMGEGFANILLIMLLAVAAFFVIRLVMRRFAPQPAAAAPMRYSPTPTQVAWPAGGSGEAQALPAAPIESPAAGTPALPEAPAAVPKAFVPASFDHEAFERAAKLIFIRLQAANDAADLDDLRSFTTPEMFASVRLDLQERGSTQQHTDVVRVEAQVLDVTQEGERQVVSVRFHGELREESGAAPAPFSEVWHLVKPLDDSRSWAIAGIEQTV